MIKYFFFHCEYMLDYFDGFSNNYHPCIPEMKPICLLWVIFLMYSWIHFGNMILRSFASPFIRGCFLSLLSLCVIWISMWLWIHRKIVAFFPHVYFALYLTIRSILEKETWDDKEKVYSFVFWWNILKISIMVI